MYRCTFYKGGYRERQEQTNADRCAAYVEQHFNSSTSPTANYAVVTGSNASQTSRNWGRWYAQAVAREFNLGVGGDQGRYGHPLENGLMISGNGHILGGGMRAGGPVAYLLSGL